MTKTEDEAVNEQVLLNTLKEDNVTTLTKLLDEGVDVDQQFFWILGDLPDMLTNSPPLISVAAFYSAVNCFDYLLSKNADINKLDEREIPLANFAVAGGCEKIIQTLDNLNVDLTKTLQIAAQYGHYQIFTWLLQNKHLDINERDEYNRTFLHIAAAGGNTELVQFLLNEGLDVNEIDGTGWTPLHFACEQNRTDVVRLLVNNPRVNVNCKDFIFESSKLMWHENGNCMPLHHAVFNQNEEIVKLLLGNSKIDVNCKDVEGRTPLHIAAMLGNEKICKLLLDSGQCDISIPANDGKTPVQYAKTPELASLINNLGSRGLWGFIKRLF